MSVSLPSQFSDLEPFVAEWANEKRSARLARRVGASYEEIEQFYSAAQPRLADMIEYLNQFPVEDIPAEARPVLWLCLGVVECARCVEVWQAPDIEAVDAGRLQHYFE